MRRNISEFSEFQPAPENLSGEITKEEVISGYKKFIDEGITSPDDLGMRVNESGDYDVYDDPRVEEAHELYCKWVKQEEEKGKVNEELRLRKEIEITMFHVDAGFTDKEYLREVRDEFLADICDDFKKHTRYENDNFHERIKTPERIETRRLYDEAVAKINMLLKRKKQKN